MDDAAARHAAVDVLDAHATARDAPIGSCLATREGAASRFPGRHDDLNLVERNRQEAQILEQPTTRGQGVWGGLRHPRIVGAAGIGLTEKEDRECRIDQQHVFDRVALVLAAITARLLSRILGALEAPFGAIVAQRGEVGAGIDAAVDRADVGAIMAAASASALPRRVANAGRDRLGVSSSARSVARSTTNRT